MHFKMIINYRATCERIHWILLALSCVLFSSYGASNGNNQMGIVAIGLSIVLMFISDEENNFNFLVAMIPFQNCWIVGGTSLRGVMCLIPMIKLLKKRRIRVTLFSLAAVGALLMIETINDLPHSSLPSFVNTICPMLYLGAFSFTVGKETNSWNIKNTINVFLMATTIACVANLIVGGGLSAYNNDVAWYRFGQESSISLLPGAMEIPLFNTICIFAILSIFAYDTVESVMWKVIYWILLAVHVLFGLLTVSRVFVIGLFSIALVFFLWMVKNKKIGRMAGLLFAIIIFGLVLYYQEKELVDLLLNKLFGRLSISNSGDNGRTYIWIDCINYLFNNPKALLIGEGIEYYPVLGRELGHDFSAMAHNYYLDIIMSVGIIGALCFVCLYTSFVNHSKKRSMLSYGVLINLALIFIVSGTLNYTRNYIYVMLGIIYMNNFKDQIENNNNGRTMLDI